MLDLRRLRLLRELKLRGTVGAVAAALSFSPSAVSQQLALLEREAGVALLTRVGRRLQLTPAAEVLVEHTAALLERVELMESELVGATTAVGGTVRLAVFQSAVLGLLPRALTELRQRHPSLRVEVVQREPEHALFEVWARDFDLVVAEQYPAHTAPRQPELDRVPLLRDELRLAGAPSLTDAADLPWAMEPRGTASRHFAEQVCRQAGFEPDVRFETADLQAHIRLVESGNACAILPDLVWGVDAPTVALVSLPGRPHRDVFTSARLSSADRPAIVAVRSVLAGLAGSRWRTHRPT
ncbi:LysR substrate-binding domain-containing protein [Galbitalea sp. SE-J8]|uniref:LysR substrate-binding domain-containing protein n=1 Tax=Galbitalea sp. SE-J8 TaxID=3054952 RepID=UPI00259C709A|nr:LysR substrate-binding domain-containing protein [Galbitalea sp. SE-J8]MDM4763339.1 LysR substrate-binding domain-containing protein [Galbitalea sp. SE-J8]